MSMRMRCWYLLSLIAIALLCAAPAVAAPGPEVTWSSVDVYAVEPNRWHGAWAYLSDKRDCGHGSPMHALLRPSTATGVGQAEMKLMYQTLLSGMLANKRMDLKVVRTDEGFCEVVRVRVYK